MVTENEFVKAISIHTSLLNSTDLSSLQTHCSGDLHVSGQAVSAPAIKIADFTFYLFEKIL